MLHSNVMRKYKLLTPNPSETSTPARAEGGRKDADAGGEQAEAGAIQSAPKGLGLDKPDQGVPMFDAEDVKGSLKIHIKLNLEADIRIIARVKGDIAIGIL
ncbi:hypothetical protein W97_04234 [Coniosporium apollinis CBS 100218]|uniref:Uncharacterized protein n=1 Tax=Coniosporium apollinis (strain CBS 100218) TaxID=1168221 RepID=R7YT43_CONA1|nr:uncharacterized protein W97_04234 [Coniosporium apollinis CBS 100218]EON64999.1 hypothetical protein W97_04234 [Coniosporium apollinis CBS 100218]